MVLQAMSLQPNGCLSETVSPFLPSLVFASQRFSDTPSELPDEPDPLFCDERCDTVESDGVTADDDWDPDVRHVELR